MLDTPPRSPKNPAEYLPEIAQYLMQKRPDENFYCALASTTPAYLIDALVAQLRQDGFTVDEQVGRVAGGTKILVS